MTSPKYRHITDELLSAYLDDAVNEQERQLVETAVADDKDVAWRLESLRQTVALLSTLPELSLPRSFVLSPEQLQPNGIVETGAERTRQQAQTPPAARPSAPSAREDAAPKPGFWDEFLAGWHDFWHAGNLALRNAAAASLVLMVALFGGSAYLGMAARSVPIVSAPAASESAAVAVAPATQRADQPAAGEAADATVEDTIVDEPVVDEPVVDENAADDTTADEAGAEAPVEESAPAEAAVDEPVATADEAQQAALAPAAREEAAQEDAPTEEDTEEEVPAAMALAEAPTTAAASVAQAEPDETTESAESEVAESEAVESPAEETAAGETASADAAPAAEAPQGQTAMLAPDMQPQMEAAPPGMIVPGVPGVVPGGMPVEGGGMGAGGGAGGGGAGGDGTDMMPGGAPGARMFPPEAYEPLPTAIPTEVASVTADAAEDAEPATKNIVTDTAVYSDTIAPPAPVDDVPQPDVDERSVAEAPREEAAPTAAPTSAVVAIVAPSPEPTATAATATEEVTEEAPTEQEEAVPATSVTMPVTTTEEQVLPVLAIAQATSILITLMLASLWWRSRKRP